MLPPPKPLGINAQRESGADLVRILAMLLICILHVGYQSGIRFLDSETHFVARAMSDFWMSFSIIAVNLYGLLTGYLCINRKWNIQRYVELWLTVCFWSLFIYLIPSLSGTYTYSIRGTLVLMNPASCMYWYFAAYSGLFLFIPILNKGLTTLQPREYRYSILLILLLFSVAGCWHPSHLAQRGYNAIWLIILYITGAYIKLHHPEIRRWKSALIFIICITINFISLRMPGSVQNALHWNYCSASSTVASMALFLLCIRAKIKSGFLVSMLRWASPMAFGVYLIQNHSFIWQQLGLMLKDYAHREEMNGWLIPVGGLLLYIVCTILDWARIKLFHVLQISRITHALTSFLPEGIRALGK